MKQIYKAAASVIALMAMTPFATKADVVTIPEGESVQTPELNVNFEFTPAVSGDLVISVATHDSFYTPTNGYTISDTKPGPWNEDNECLSNVRWKEVFPNYELTLSVTQGTTYYLLCNNKSFWDIYYDKKGFTFTLTGKGGNPEPGDGPSGTFEVKGAIQKFTPSQSGYILVTFDSSTDMTGYYGATVYTWKDFGSFTDGDVALSAIETDGEATSSQGTMGYGNYQGYTGVTKAVFEVTGGTDYCIMQAPNSGSYAFYTEKPNIGGEDPMGDVYIKLGEPITVKKGQKAILENPGNLNARVSYQVQIQTNSLQDLGDFISDDYPSSLKSNTTSSQNETGWVYTVTGTPGIIFPMWLQEDVVDEVTYTVTMPSDEIKDLKFDVEFSATEGEKFQFNNTYNPGVLTVTNKGQLNNEKIANRMIYKDKDFQTVVSTNTKGKEGESDTDNTAGNYEPNASGEYVVTYNLPSQTTYYFKAPFTGNFKFVLSEKAAVEPSTAQATIAAPKADVSAIYSFTVYWEGQPVTEGSMDGVTVTGPENETYTVKKLATSAATESSANEDGLLIQLSMDKLPTVAGDYKIYLPQGVVEVDGKPNAETTLTFTWAPDTSKPTFSIESAVYTPSTDKYYTSISSAEISFPEMPIYVVGTDKSEFDVTVNDVTYTATVKNGNTIIIENLDMTYSPENATIEIVIPENSVRNQSEDVNPEITVTYVLLPTTDAVEVSPESGYSFSLADDDWTVAVTWNDQISFNDFDSIADLGITIQNEDNEDATNSKGEPLVIGDIVAMNADNTGFEINLSSLGEGGYVITIPAETIVIGSTSAAYLNDEVEIGYYITLKTIGLLEDVEPAVEPEEGAVAALESVSISWEGYDLVINQDCQQTISLTSSDNTEIAVTAIDEDNSLVISFDSLAVGEYTLVVPAEFVILSKDGTDYYNEPVSLHYTVDKSVGATLTGADANGEINVYNINGAKVATGNANTIKGLEKGIYIINGKKIYIR